MQELPLTLPPFLQQLASHAVATIIGVVASLYLRKKREPVELDKLRAETRSLDVQSDVAVAEVVMDAAREVARIAGDAERLRDERDHWERKAKEEMKRADLLQIEVNTMDLQMRKLNGYVHAKGLDPTEMDK